MSREFINTANLLVVDRRLSTTRVNYLDTVYKPGDKKTKSKPKKPDGLLSTAIDSSNFGEISIMPKIAEVKLEKQRISLNIDNKNLENLTLIGVDGETEAVSVLLGELEQSKGKKLFDNYKTLGDENFQNELTSFQKKIQKWSKTYQFVYHIKEKKQTEYDTIRKLIAKILTFSNRIAIKSRRGPANFLVTNGQIGALIQESPSFVSTLSNIIISRSSDIFQIGTIGTIKVFINPHLKYTDNVIIMGRASVQNELSGTFILEETMPLVKTTDVEGGKTIDIENVFTIYNTPDAKSRYETFKISLDPTPWWKKLLKL